MRLSEREGEKIPRVYRFLREKLMYQITYYVNKIMHEDMKTCFLPICYLVIELRFNFEINDHKNVKKFLHIFMNNDNIQIINHRHEQLTFYNDNIQIINREHKQLKFLLFNLQIVIMHKYVNN